MTRVLPALAAGLLAGTGPAAAQVTALRGAPAPVPPAFGPAVRGPVPYAGLARGPVPYAAVRGPGLVGGYGGLPAFTGGFIAPSFFPYTYGAYGAYGATGLGYSYPYGFGYGYNYGATTAYDSVVPPATGLVGTNYGPTPAVTPPVVYPLPSSGGGRPAGANVALSGTQTATLAVALPAAGRVWVDGVEQKDAGASYSLTSPPLAAGQSHACHVRAEWAAGGKRYGAERTVTLAAGDRQKLTLVLGDPLPEK